MSIVASIQHAIKDAMKSKSHARLECLRMVKAALLLKEKETGSEVAEPDAIAVLRGEVRKRQQSLEIFRQHDRQDEAAATEREIAVIEEFLPRQLSASELEARVRAHYAAHPELNHAGKLTGAIKKEIGDLADGKMLNDICRKVIEG
ncbi:MAG TPA: GatB/YqeY domain-containing protein [Candidatus Hydrogenedentes bacterium]|nr:GatB/YqeY domain-containing protein [Candidatus Hydrogenedentota bacterium]HOS03551.1 GatB/YqeY domain-containing protein [Candidatus Hydrogenedentota bacterium]